MNGMVIGWHRPDFLWMAHPALARARAGAATPRYEVFIVEDHAGMRRALRRVVSRSGKLHVVGEAASAEEALETFAKGLPRVAMVDINLPGMSGLDLIRTMKQQHPQVRCVVVSAYSGLDRRRAALQAGAQGFVSKDEPAEIVAAVLEAAEMNGE